MELPFKYFRKREWILWIISLVVVCGSNLLSPEFSPVILVAALVGTTSLVFAAKGNVWSQILIIIFSVLYGVISFQYRYWGEMVTYLGMTLPMAVWSTVVWFKNPSDRAGEVKISSMNKKKWMVLITLSVLVTALFCVILKYFNTPNLILSTLSITTSFLAASLTILRASYFALFYAANDIVLIVLWTMATIENPIYFL